MAGLIPGQKSQQGRKGQKGQPSQQGQPDQGTAALYRRSQLALGAAFVALVGAVVAFVLHARVVGIVLLVLMLLGGMVSFYFSVQFRNRAVAQARAARQEQAARAAGNRKASRPGRD
jgi:uncharacterized membrane-anchored protein